MRMNLISGKECIYFLVSLLLVYLQLLLLLLLFKAIYIYICFNDEEEKIQAADHETRPDFITVN
jgi:hypothetical protein